MVWEGGGEPALPRRQTSCKQWNILEQQIRHFITVFVIAHLFVSANAKFASGCGGKRRQGLFSHTDVAPCQGSWRGHVTEGTELCGKGWDVCSWKDSKKLQSISWKEALSFSGCFVYNAEQMYGNCEECSRNSITGRLAGVGRSCKHRTKSGTSCISGGVIDAGMGDYPCGYDPQLMTGVLCCAQQKTLKRPKLTLTPPPVLNAYNGLIFVLPCRAAGSPKPQILWYKDGRRLLGNDTRISLLKSGDLLISLAHRTDTGVYTCEAVSRSGTVKSSSQVNVAENEPGCSDGSIEGLHPHTDVHACSGRWRGHVKRAGFLCARGWSVCNPRDVTTLSEIGWDEIGALSGCYAYNAANTWGRCTKCYKNKMAGIGHDCGRRRLHRTSCLAQGRVDVFWPRRRSSCEFKAGVTSGVLCCKKRRRKPIGEREISDRCDPRCMNGGFCVGVNKCHCIHGYKGANCQIPICKPACGYGEQCTSHNKCRCARSVAGRKCRLNKRRKCPVPCLHGGRCVQGQCKCQWGSWGNMCQHGSKQLNMEMKLTS